MSKTIFAVVVLVVGGWFLYKNYQTSSVSNSNSSTNPFTTSTFVATGKSITGTIEKNSNKSGVIVLWLEQNGVKKCPRSYRLGENTGVDLKFNCLEYRGGSFEVVVGWADEFPNIASTAKPIN